MALTEKQRQALAEKLVKSGPKKPRVNGEEAVKRYLAGERVKDIAGSYGVLPETIYVHLRKARDGK